MASPKKKKKVAVKTNEPVKPRKESAPVSAKPDKIYAASSAVIVVLFLITWNQWYKPVVKDPWQVGVELVDSAQKIQDSAVRNQLMDDARDRFYHLVQVHPYHARLWLQKGYYHLRRQEWDSTVLCQKKAIELGHGGMINAIEFDAAQIMVSALTQKFQAEMLDSSRIFPIIDSCEVAGFDNYKLNWLRGVVKNQYRNFREGSYWLERAYKLKPRDFDNLYHYGYSLAMLGQRDQAIGILRQAQALQPENQNVKSLISNLSAQN